MPESWVVNASPLIVLSQIGQDRLLSSLARRCARSLTVPYKGTLAVIILAKQRGFISSAASVINELRDVGYYIDDYTIAEALLKTVGEDWPP